jgi:hypothetical protein
MSTNTTPSDRPTGGDEAEYAATVIGAPAIYGPPVALLFGPWLFLVLLLAPPFAFLVTVMLVVAVAAVLLAAIAAVLVSPYLLMRHLRARWAGQSKAATPSHLFHKARVSSDRLGSPQPKGMS